MKMSFSLTNKTKSINKIKQDKAFYLVRQTYK